MVLNKDTNNKSIKVGGFIMKISCIKSNKDNESFNFFKSIGCNIVELNDLEKVDNEINNLIHEKYKTIILSNDVAGFSEDIIKKYRKEDSINIIIAPRKSE